MGQYYRGAILGKTSKKRNKFIVRKAFCCYVHENGAKLMEHSYVGNYYVKEYEHSLANEFDGYPFVWVGDYADAKFGEDDGYTKQMNILIHLFIGLRLKEVIAPIKTERENISTIMKPYIAMIKGCKTLRHMTNCLHISIS